MKSKSIFIQLNNTDMQQIGENGHLEYWRKNKLHRDNNEPAVCTNDFAEKEWWENGVRIIPWMVDFMENIRME